MQIIEYPFATGQSLPTATPMAIALGFFDGLHLGHRALILRTVEAAGERGLTPAIFTFSSESPALKGEARRIYSTEDKLRIFETLGVHTVILADFDRISGVSAEDFLTRVLGYELNCKFAACGYNFRFGSRATGDAALLRRVFSEMGREAFVLEEQTYLGTPLSASAVRDMLAEGNMKSANKMLGEPYSIFGRVQKGLGIGRSFGFPTVNLPMRADSPLRRGVYGSRVKIGEKVYTGVTNVGVCPTFGERELHSETMILDFSGDLYGEELTVYLLDYLRDEISFPSPEELKKQIDTDAALAREINEGRT